MSSTKFVSVLMNTFPEFGKHASGEVFSQDNAPCHVPRQVSKYINSMILDVQYAMEHKTESDCITKPVDSMENSLQKVLKNKGRTTGY